MLDYSSMSKIVGSNNMQGSYLFMGKEKYLMEDLVKKTVNKYINPSFLDLNYSKLEGKDIDLEDLISTCETLPFMSEKRLVVVNNISAFISNIDTKQDKLYEYLNNTGDFLILILVDSENQLKKNMKIYKYFNKKNTYVDFDKLYGANLNKWIEKIVSHSGKKITMSNINYFTQKSSYTSKNVDVSLYELRNELNKVIDYASNIEITKQDIDAVLIDPIDTNIFELLDSITRLDVNRALNLFDEMYMSNEPVQRIFFMITRQIRLIYGYKLYMKKGYSPSLIQKKLKIGSFEFNKIKNQSKNFSNDRLLLIMNELLIMDIKMKTTQSNDKLLMEMFIVKLCSLR